MNRALATMCRLVRLLFLPLLLTSQRPAVAAADAGPGRWAILAPMPTGRYSLAATTEADGRIYALGGFNGRYGNGFLTTVEVYSPANNSWSAGAPMPAPREFFAAVTAPDGRIYALGGNNTANPLAAWTVLNSMDVFDPTSGRWSPVAGMHDARMSFGATLGPDGRIYAIGGQDQGNQPLASVEAYTPATNSWVWVASLPTARFGVAAVTGPDGRIYAIGGRTSEAVGAAGTSEVDAYDPRTNTWRRVADLEAPRWGGSAAVAGDGRIYAFGGIASQRQLPDLVEAYDPLTNRWQPAPPPFSTRDDAAATTGRDGRVYLVGGIDRRRLADGTCCTYTDLEVFIPTANPVPAGAPSQPGACRFVLGFATIHAAVPTIVGDCLEDEQHNPTNGDALQQTTNGLLVWRRSDNFTAFTDGYRTWVDGPDGIQERLNTLRFPWEANPDNLPTVGGAG